MSLSEQLREAIRNSGLSANALARATGVPQPAISTFLAGKDIRFERTADKLAAYFGLELVRRGEPAAAEAKAKKAAAKRKK